MKKMSLNEVGDIMENIEAVIFELIVHSGNARGMLFEALDAAEADNHEQSVMCMQQAEAEMTIAHNLQTKLIQDDLKGQGQISLLLIHAQDQLMTTMSEQALIERLIKMQQQLNQFNQN